MKVAVIGTTGRLGRETIVRLSKKGIATRCLLRHGLPNENSKPPLSLEHAQSKEQVLLYLASLPGVEFVEGDVTDPQSLQRLIDADTTACLALYGPVVPKPFFRSLFPIFFPETLPIHSKQVNYVGVKNLLQAMEESPSCKRLVRITGKGETPWSIFSILINAFGGMAKGWNYEAEELIRSNCNIDYTIIRPGIMKDFVEKEDKMTLGLRDNGGDMKVSAVSYARIADLVIQAFQRDTCKRCTVTAMNVENPSHDNVAATAVQTLDQLQPDTRKFPGSLIAEHKKAARVGGVLIVTMTFLFTTTILHVFVTLLERLITWFMNTFQHS